MSKDIYETEHYLAEALADTDVETTVIDGDETQAPTIQVTLNGTLICDVLIDGNGFEVIFQDDNDDGEYGYRQEYFTTVDHIAEACGA